MKSKTSLPTNPSVSIQQTLRPVLPVIKGCKEYRDQETLILKIDRLLKVSGIEELFLKLSLEEDEARALASGKQRDESGNENVLLNTALGHYVVSSCGISWEAVFVR